MTEPYIAELSASVAVIVGLFYAIRKNIDLQARIAGLFYEGRIMTVYEMEGFLRGKCLPGDMKVNESNAQYLVRKFSEFESNLSESKREFRAADATIHNLELKLTDLAVQLANAESKCRELAGLVAENADLKSLIEQHACSIAVCPNCSHEEPSETDDIVALYRSLKTPFTDAFLAEVRAQGVERMIEVKQQQLDGMHPDTFAIGAVRDSIRRDIYELKVFAEILRQEAAQ